jgi:hypothetical protein
VHLRLGLSLTHLPSSSPVGFHGSIAFFDLAGYLSFEEGLNVRTPNPFDALFPTLSLGVAFGRELPIVITADVGWQPSFRFHPSGDPDEGDVPPVALPAVQTERRSDLGYVNVGLSVGIHVPLLDFN